MTSLMNWVRRTEVRRGASAVVGATFLLAVAGCNSDRTSNADERRPIAVTASGVEIMEVVRSPDERIVEAVVVAGGEETQVTFEPLLDGPLPSGLVVSVQGSGRETVELAYGWDVVTGATWVRQRAEGDTFALLRGTTSGRVVEEYQFNDRTLRLEYADLPPAETDQATAGFLRGESLESATPETMEFEGQLRKFDAFARQLPAHVTSPTAEGQLLTSLLGDPVFARALVGDEIVPQNFVRELCNRINQCTALICRLFPTSTLCGVCLSGSLACIILDWWCATMGC